MNSCSITKTINNKNNLGKNKSLFIFETEKKKSFLFCNNSQMASLGWNHCLSMVFTHTVCLQIHYIFTYLWFGARRQYLPTSENLTWILTLFLQNNMMKLSYLISSPITISFIFYKSKNPYRW